jgi:hypothetical protein
LSLLYLNIASSYSFSSSFFLSFKARASLLLASTWTSILAAFSCFLRASSSSYLRIASAYCFMRIFSLSLASCSLILYWYLSSIWSTIT